MRYGEFWYKDTDNSFRLPILIDDDIFNGTLPANITGVSYTGADARNALDALGLLPCIDRFGIGMPTQYVSYSYSGYSGDMTQIITETGLPIADNVTLKATGEISTEYPNFQNPELFQAVPAGDSIYGHGSTIYTAYHIVDNTIFPYSSIGVNINLRYPTNSNFSISVPILPESAFTDDGKIRASYWNSQSQPNRYFTITFSVDAARTKIDSISFSSTGIHNSNSEISNALQNLLYLSDYRLVPDTPASTDDPYIDAGYAPSTAPGGMSQGSFDFTEDGLTAVHTPSMDVLGAGLVTCWNPSKAQLAAVASWLWSTQPAQILQDLLGNPINAIIGLNILPVQPDVDGGTNTIHFGPEDTAVAAPKCTSQYVTVDCGSLKIEPKYGSYMDYAPPASAELFLPYCGGVPLDINDVIDKTITIKYQVDILSGACVAYVFIDGTLHYQRPGACAATVPITGVQMPNVVSGALSIVGAVAGAIASLGASGAGTAAKVASGIATGTSIASTAANMLKQQISYSGTVSGWAGLLGAQTPYVILALPHATIPGGQNVIMGYPAWVSGRIGDFSGYTECKIDHVYALGATDAEVDEIKTLLEGGVIL